MNAIVLAAGVGSRLRPLTNHKPKTMVEINGVPILGIIIRALLDCGVEHIAVCTGYLSEMVRGYCLREFPPDRVHFVENREFPVTNNMYSLYLAAEYLCDDCFVMNADLCFDADILRLLCAHSGTGFAVDAGRYLEESMKVTVGNGRITGISKTFQPAESYGCSIDIYRIAAADAPGADMIELTQLERTDIP